MHTELTKQQIFVVRFGLTTGTNERQKPSKVKDNAGTLLQIAANIDESYG